MQQEAATVGSTSFKGMTLERHIREEERNHPGGAGALHPPRHPDHPGRQDHQRPRSTRRALVDILGLTGEVNVQGEEVQKLDEYANDVLRKALDHTGSVAALASEEMEEVYDVPGEYIEGGEYVVLYDPLDGSSNIDVNVSIGSIFSILRRKGGSGPTGLDDFLQPGVEQVCAGYVIYGSSTMLVYTTGNGVDGFTLDPSVGEFLPLPSRHPDSRAGEDLQHQRGQLLEMGRSHHPLRRVFERR